MTIIRLNMMVQKICVDNAGGMMVDKIVHEMYFYEHSNNLMKLETSDAMERQ